MSFADTVDIKTFTLEKHMVASCLECDDLAIREADASAHYDMISQRIIAELRAFIWCEDVQKETRGVLYPANCWQHLKERFFLKDGWVRKKWPVKMERETLTFEVKATYPGFRPAIEKHALRFTGRVIETPTRVGTI